MTIHQTRFARISRWSIGLALLNLLAACGGGGGGPSNFAPPTPPGPAPATVTVSGKITFDRIPFDTTAGTGLNPNAPVESPARGIIVEAISGSSVAASTTTNDTGDYSLTVASNTQIFIRARARMLKADAAPTWDFSVRNNTNGDALYVLDGAVFDSGVANSTRNLRATSGWTGTGYGSTRAAAPFAILDTVYQAKNLIISAAPSAVFQPLNLYWSPSNRAGTTDANDNPIFCIDNGDVQTTMYVSAQAADDCDGQILPGIYVLGNVEGGDTDEFDQHVIAHEFGHYIENTFSRSDSIGGEHGTGQRLDLRVAFGEGWGNAFSGMALNDPIYRDSFNLAASDFSINMEVGDTTFDDGWFSEASVEEIIWDAFDSTNESGDGLSLGFGPIFTAMTGGQRTTDAMTSIFSFLEALRAAVPAQATAINQLRNGQNISGTNAFGAGESNNGGPAISAQASNIPIYRSIALNVPQVVCVTAANGVPNKLGNNTFFRLDLGSTFRVTVNALAAADQNTPGSEAAVDPDIFVFRQGVVVASGEGGGASEMTQQTSLSAGTYIIEVLDFELDGGNPPHCMTVSVQGT